MGGAVRSVRTSPTVIPGTSTVEPPVLKHLGRHTVAPVSVLSRRPSGLQAFRSAGETLLRELRKRVIQGRGPLRKRLLLSTFSGSSRAQGTAAGRRREEGLIRAVYGNRTLLAVAESRGPGRPQVDERRSADSTPGRISDADYRPEFSVAVIRMEHWHCPHERRIQLTGSPASSPVGTTFAIAQATPQTHSDSTAGQGSPSPSLPQAYGRRAPESSAGTPELPSMPADLPNRTS